MFPSASGRSASHALIHHLTGGAAQARREHLAGSLKQRQQAWATCLNLAVCKTPGKIERERQRETEREIQKVGKGSTGSSEEASVSRACFHVCQRQIRQWQIAI